MDILVSILGWLATVISVFFLLPQLIKTFKTRSAKDLSIISDSISFLSNLLWVFYSVFKSEPDWKLFTTNFLIMVTTFSLLVYQIIWNLKNKSQVKANWYMRKAKRMSLNELENEIKKMEAE